MIITSQSHLDHGLSVAALAHTLVTLAKRSAFLAETLVLPAGVPSVPCALVGPVMGDDAVDEAEVSYVVRGDRKGASRMIAALARPVRQLTVIAGPADGGPCVLYTAFGGPLAPREPWEVQALFDAGKATEEELGASKLFWRVHALATNHGGLATPHKRKPRAPCQRCGAFSCL